MSNYIYTSVLKDEMRNYIKIRKSQGFKCAVNYVFESLDRYLVSQRISEKSLSANVVDGWIAYLRNDKKVEWVNKYVASYKQFAKYLYNFDIQVFTPDYHRKCETYVPYIFTEQEITNIFDIADNLGRNRSISSKLQFPLLLRILYGCGLRLGEALTLIKSDVDSENGVIFIRNAKNDRDRLVPIDPSLTEILSLYCNGFMEDKDKDAFLFTKGNNCAGHHSQSWARYNFDVVLKSAGIEKLSLPPKQRNICLHCLRHTFIINSFRKQELAGIDNYDVMPSISIYVGHYDLDGTQRYLHMTAENSEDIIKKTDEYSKGMYPKICNEAKCEINTENSNNSIRENSPKPLIKTSLEKIINECSKGMFPEVTH